MDIRKAAYAKMLQEQGIDEPGWSQPPAVERAVVAVRDRLGRIAGELDKLRTGLVPRGAPPVMSAITYTPT